RRRRRRIVRRSRLQFQSSHDVVVLSRTRRMANLPSSLSMTHVDPRLLAFVGFAALLTILPGSDMALVTRNVLAIGRRRTLATIVGICLGCVIHATASALGISAVLATSATAFNVMKTVGAAYLIWIGVQSIRTAGAPVGPIADRARGRTSPF